MSKAAAGARTRSRLIRATGAVLVCGVLVTATTESTGGTVPVDRASVSTGPAATDVDRSTTVTGSRVDRHTKPRESAPRTSTVAPDGTVCAGGESATLGVVFDAVFDSFIPQLPAPHRPAARAVKSQVLTDMHNMAISDLAVSLHPHDLGASEDAPINKYRDPISQWIVTQLMNVKDGKAGQRIRVDNLTVSQAVETAWLYFYLTAVIPLTLVKDTMPTFFTVGPVSLGTLITLPITIGTAGMKMLYGAISDAIIGGCMARMTPEQIEQAGQVDPDIDFSEQVPQIISDIAGQVAIAEPDTCPAIADMTLGRVVDRTGDYLQAVAPNKRAARDIGTRLAGLKQFMKTTRVPHNLVPADPADFTTVETLLSTGLGLVPYAGGAVTDALIGLGHNLGNGADLGKTVPLSKLTVTKSLTAAYYAYAITTQVISLIQDQAASTLAVATGGIDLMPRVDGIINAPNTYGLVVYHNVLRSLCLEADRADDSRTAKPVAAW